MVVVVAKEHWWPYLLPDLRGSPPHTLKSPFLPLSLRGFRDLKAVFNLAGHRGPFLPRHSSREGS